MRGLCPRKQKPWDFFLKKIKLDHAHLCEPMRASSLPRNRFQLILGCPIKLLHFLIRKNIFIKITNFFLNSHLIKSYLIAKIPLNYFEKSVVYRFNFKSQIDTSFSLLSGECFTLCHPYFFISQIDIPCSSQTIINLSSELVLVHHHRVSLWNVHVS